MFALFYSSKEKKVEAVNGSGRSPKASTIESIKADIAEKGDDWDDVDRLHSKLRLSVHSVTVPGAAR